jgi:hypothetical protein
MAYGAEGRPVVHDFERLSERTTHLQRPHDMVAMTVPCLEEMLLSSLFRPRLETLTLLPQHEIDGRKVGRVGLVAEAVAPDADIGLPAILTDVHEAASFARRQSRPRSSPLSRLAVRLTLARSGVATSASSDRVAMALPSFGLPLVLESDCRNNHVWVCPW